MKKKIDSQEETLTVEIAFHNLCNQGNSVSLPRYTRVRNQRARLVESQAKRLHLLGLWSHWTPHNTRHLQHEAIRICMRPLGLRERCH